jgi:ubiquinone biosynthesis protein
MVVVEGVARGLDPNLDIWTAAEPIAREWVEQNLGPAGAIKDAREGASELGRFLAEVPALLGHAERTLTALAEAARDGVRLDEDTVQRMAAANARNERSGKLALWVGAMALVAVAIALFR